VSVERLTASATVPAPTVTTAGVCPQPELRVALQVAASTTAIRSAWLP
jgi:hypothetical protein